MNRITIIAAIAALGVASTAVIATAKGGPDRERGARAGGIERMFETLDTNADGSITKEEATAVAAARFAETDSDGNGVLSAEEMAAAMDKEVSERRAKRIEARITRLDKDGDGGLSFEEATAGADRLERMFEHLDADGDGTITQAEAENAKPLRRGRDGGGRHGEERRNN